MEIRKIIFLDWPRKAAFKSVQKRGEKDGKAIGKKWKQWNQWSRRYSWCTSFDRTKVSLVLSLSSHFMTLSLMHWAVQLGALLAGLDYSIFKSSLQVINLDILSTLWSEGLCSWSTSISCAWKLNLHLVNIFFRALDLYKATTRPLFSNKYGRDFVQEQYPNVYDSQIGARQSSAFAGGKQVLEVHSGSQSKLRITPLCKLFHWQGVWLQNIFNFNLNKPMINFWCW